MGLTVFEARHLPEAKPSDLPYRATRRPKGARTGVRFVLELSPTADGRVEGSVGWDGVERSVRFSGWLELLRLLEGNVISCPTQAPGMNEWDCGAVVDHLVGFGGVRRRCPSRSEPGCKASSGRHRPDKRITLVRQADVGDEAHSGRQPRRSGSRLKYDAIAKGEAFLTSRDGSARNQSAS